MHIKLCAQSLSLGRIALFLHLLKDALGHSNRTGQILRLQFLPDSLLCLHSRPVNRLSKQIGMSCSCRQIRRLNRSMVLFGQTRDSFKNLASFHRMSSLQQVISAGKFYSCSIHCGMGGWSTSHWGRRSAWRVYYYPSRREAAHWAWRSTTHDYYSYFQIYILIIGQKPGGVIM
jgi:hypothetical protein